MLHFAEIYRTQPGRRVVNIELEGSTVRTNCDVVARVSLQAATTEIYQVLLTDGVKRLFLRYRSSLLPGA